MRPYLHVQYLHFVGVGGGGGFLGPIQSVTYRMIKRKRKIPDIGASRLSFLFVYGQVPES